jgi:hypothetical protein
MISIIGSSSNLSRAAVRIFSAALVICFLAVVSCSKDIKETPAESIVAASTVKLLDNIKGAYTGRNMARLAELTTPEGYRDLGLAIKQFDRATLRFTPTWMEMKGSRMEVYVAWEGKWEIGKDVTEERGLAVFVIVGNPSKLDEVHRASPFVYPQ